MGLRMGPDVLDPGLVMQDGLDHTRNPISNNPTPLFVYNNLSIKKTWVTYVDSHKLKDWE